MEIQVKWLYKNKAFKKIPKNCFGFIYKITNIETNEFYIGSKQFYFISNKIMSKKKKLEYLNETGLRRKKIKHIKESDWMSYISSSKKVQAMIVQNPNIFKFEVLELFETKSEMLLTEAVMIGKEFLKRNSLLLNDWLSVRCQKLK